MLFCWLASVVIVCRLSSATLPACGPAGRRARGRSARRRPVAWESGGRHCTAGQYGYVPLGRHLVYHRNQFLKSESIQRHPHPSSFTHHFHYLYRDPKNVSLSFGPKLPCLVADIIKHFYPRDAMLARYLPSSSCVCLSVRMSQVGVLPRRLNLGSRKQRHTIALGL